MSNESLLKKDFQDKDVKRIRNLIQKDYTGRTTSGSGYEKKRTKHKEGDVWEEGGRTWTIKNGIKQNVTKLDAAKKALRVPLTCPKCGGSMKHHLSKKMYKIHGFCFNCTVDYEATLRRAGLYEEYEKKMMMGNLESFGNSLEAFVLDSLEETANSYVTEHGVVEKWKHNSKANKEKVVKDLNEFLKHLRSKL